MYLCVVNVLCIGFSCCRYFDCNKQSDGWPFCCLAKYTKDNPLWMRWLAAVLLFSGLFFKEKIQNTLIYFVKNVTLHFVRETSRMMKTNVFFAKNNLVSVRFAMETFDWWNTDQKENKVLQFCLISLSLIFFFHHCMISVFERIVWNHCITNLKNQCINCTVRTKGQDHETAKIL